MKEIYLSLLRAALWKQKPAPLQLSETEWNSLLLLNAQQGTGPLVYPMLLEQEDVPEVVRMQMKSVCISTIQQQVHLQHTLEQAWTALEKADLRPVLMKGAGLAALYPTPQQRTWGDIDLFVGKYGYHSACAVMRDTFPGALKFDEELDHYKHYNLIADGISIEIHRVSIGFQHPIDEYKYRDIEAYGMCPLCVEKEDINGLRVKVPESTFNLLFILLHSWEHAISQGANLRQCCDLAYLLYRRCYDPTPLRDWLCSLHVMDVWRIYMYILVNYLGLPEQEAMFYKNNEDIKLRAERFLDDLLNGRLVAPKPAAQAPSNRFVRKFHTMQDRWRNAQRIAAYSPAYARHMKAETLLHGALRLFAKDRHWE